VDRKITKSLPLGVGINGELPKGGESMKHSGRSLDS